MTTTAEDRKARAVRARQAGNAKAKAVPAAKAAPPAASTTATARTAVKRVPSKPAKIDPVPVAAKDVRAAVRSMDLTHVQCRDFGHSWRPYTARWLSKFNQYESQLVCSRCTTIRTRFLSRTGEQLGGGYDYADGYLIKGLGRLSGHDRDEVRLASILAVLVEDTAAES